MMEEAAHPGSEHVKLAPTASVPARGRRMSPVGGAAAGRAGEVGRDVRRAR
jgi:hypothetical protein